MNNEEQMAMVLGTVAMVPKGEYSSEAYYEKLNTVLYNDSTYMAIQPSTGILPTNTDYWQLIGGGVKKENTIIVYNSVADMKADTKLKVGMHVKTNGYYTANDGGGAEYLIKESSSSYYETLTNNLVAELIIENDYINIKTFGAKGDGITDDTNVFINAINVLKSKYEEKGIFNTSLIMSIPSGRYLINDTIEIPIIIKIKLLGDVYILSNVTDTTIWFNSGNYLRVNENSNIIYQQSFNINDIIGGNGVLCIERNTEDKEHDVNDLTSNSIAIEIGDRTYTANTLNVARMKFKNIAISGFSKGIQLNSINTYLLAFDSIRLERNRINFSYSDTGMPTTNSGENFKILNSTLAQSYNAFVNNSAGQFTFDNCSFDFNGNCILLKKSSHIILNSPHFEGVGFNQQGIIDANENNCTGFGTIIYSNYNSDGKTDVAAVEINNPDYYLASSTNALIPRFQTSFNGNYPNLYINHNSLKYFTEGGYTYDNVFMNSKNVVINNFNTTMQNATLPTIPFNDNDNAGKLNNISNSLNSLTTLENNYQISTQNVENVSVDTTNKIFDKSLKFAISGKTYQNIRRKIKNINGKKLTAVAWFKSNMVGDTDTFDKFAVTINFYFYNKQGISMKDNTTITLSNNHLIYDDNNEWFITKPCVVDVPTGTDEIMINYSLVNKNSNDAAISASGDLWFGGLVVDSLS